MSLPNAYTVIQARQARLQAAGRDPAGAPNMGIAAIIASGAQSALQGASALATQGGRAVRTAEQQAQCIALCQRCDHLIRQGILQGHCDLCLCRTAWKAKLLTWHCPLPDPKW